MKMKSYVFAAILLVTWLHGYLASDINHIDAVDRINSNAQERIDAANGRTIAMFNMATNYKLKLMGEQNEKNISNCLRNYNVDCLRNGQL